MVPDGVGGRILNYIRDLEEEDTFQVGTIQTECAPDHAEAAVQHFLLDHLGENDPHYVVAATGSEDPGDWFPGAGFRVPPEEGRTFEYPSEDSTEVSGHLETPSPKIPQFSVTKAQFTTELVRKNPVL